LLATPVGVLEAFFPLFDGLGFELLTHKVLPALLSYQLSMDSLLVLKYRTNSSMGHKEKKKLKRKIHADYHKLIKTMELSYEFRNKTQCISSLRTKIKLYCNKSHKSPLQLSSKPRKTLGKCGSKDTDNPYKF
jgi:hypothetical protein